MNKITVNEINKAIANILHNIDCIDEAMETTLEDKRKYIAEKRRLNKQLHYYNNLLDEAGE